MVGAPDTSILSLQLLIRVIFRHVDGHDYMWAVSEMIDRAQEVIFILVRLHRSSIRYTIFDPFQGLVAYP